VREKCNFIAALQITPQDILLVVTSENFWECIDVLNVHHIRLRFLEERDSNLDIHLSISVHKVSYKVTFRIVEYNSHTLSELEKYFPPATVYIQEIRRES
jgi:hypothetical protein